MEDVLGPSQGANMITALQCIIKLYETFSYYWPQNFGGGLCNFVV
jgi:hypothetical protein